MDDHLRAAPGLRYDTEQLHLGRAGARVPRSLADLHGPWARRQPRPCRPRRVASSRNRHGDRIDRSRRPRSTAASGPGADRCWRCAREPTVGTPPDPRTSGAPARPGSGPARRSRRRCPRSGRRCPCRRGRDIRRSGPSSTGSACSSTRQLRPGSSTRLRSEASRDSRPPSASASAGGRLAPVPMLNRAIRRGSSESGARLHGALSGTSAHADARAMGAAGWAGDAGARPESRT